MKLVIAALLCISATSTSYANNYQRGHSNQTYARVTHVEPIYQQTSYREPVQECYEERVTSRSNGSRTNTIIGGLLGGALGNELGHNRRNKKVGTLAGAVLGASIANDLSRNKGRDRVHYEQRCDTRYNTNYRQEITGYQVSYRYDGQTYQTQTDQHPGKRIPVSINVHPVKERYSRDNRRYNKPRYRNY